jgi:putative zinc finger protein
MTVEGCREWREQLGAYVLGQLSDDETAAVRAHIEGCAACRAEAESLAPLAELLSIADPAQLGAAPAPPVELGDRIAARISREGRTKKQRRRRRRFAIGFSGAAAAAAAAAVLFAVVISSGGGNGNDAQHVKFAALPKGVAIGATLEPRSIGTQIRMNVHGIRSGTLCRVFLRRADGTRVSAGSFVYRYGGNSQAVLTSALDLSNARAIGVRAGDRTFVARIKQGVGAEAWNSKSTDKEYS